MVLQIHVIDANVLILGERVTPDVRIVISLPLLIEILDPCGRTLNC